MLRGSGSSVVQVHGDFTHSIQSTVNGDQICQFLRWNNLQEQIACRTQIGCPETMIYNIQRVVDKVIHFNSIKDLVINNGEYVRLISDVDEHAHHSRFKKNERTKSDLRLAFAME